MKVIIAGGRDFTPTKLHKRLLRVFLLTFKVTEVVCGEAKGADTFGKNIALAMNIHVESFPAKWKTFGKAAGYIRNEDMAKYADSLIVFKGGNGTASMIKLANKYKLNIIYNENIKEVQK